MLVLISTFILQKGLRQPTSSFCPSHDLLLSGQELEPMKFDFRISVHHSQAEEIYKVINSQLNVMEKFLEIGSAVGTQTMLLLGVSGPWSFAGYRS